MNGVFWHVFSQLDGQVTIYPTENYFYFTFYANWRYFWGNMRLAPEERDKGILHFAYFEYNDDPKDPDDFYSEYKQFGPSDGITIKKISAFTYSVTYRNKTVIFRLNQINQIPPKLFALKENEVFISRTWDESGFQFFLIFDKDHLHFMWILNEEDGIPGVFEPLSDEIAVDKLSGFAFYLDRSSQRKILIGVNAQNIKRNNYYDGPFDQLADNYIKNTDLAKYIQQAYPYTRNRINEYGIFTDVQGSRVSITPYYTYYSKSELVDLLSNCHEEPPEKFYSCIAYDYKTSVPPP